MNNYTLLLQRQILELLHSNYVSIEKTLLFTKELVYGINMNTDIEQTVKQSALYLEYQCTELHEIALHYDIPFKPWELVCADILMVNSKTLLSIVDYYSKLQGVNRLACLSADDLVHTPKLHLQILDA